MLNVLQFSMSDYPYNTAVQYSHVYSNNHTVGHNLALTEFRDMLDIESNIFSLDNVSLRLFLVH